MLLMLRNVPGNFHVPDVFKRNASLCEYIKNDWQDEIIWRGFPLGYSRLNCFHFQWTSFYKKFIWKNYTINHKPVELNLLDWQKLLTVVENVSPHQYGIASKEKK